MDFPQKYKELPYVDFIGFLNKNKEEEYRKFIQIISSSDIFILPTKAECAGIVFAEASAYGLPIFTYDTGGVGNYVINEINGYRLPLKCNANEFSEQIKDCVTTKKLDQMHKTAVILYKERLNWDRWSTCFKSIIENINTHKV